MDTRHCVETSRRTSADASSNRLRGEARQLSGLSDRKPAHNINADVSQPSLPGLLLVSGSQEPKQKTAAPTTPAAVGKGDSHATAAKVEKGFFANHVSDISELIGSTWRGSSDVRQALEAIADRHIDDSLNELEQSLTKIGIDRDPRIRLRTGAEFVRANARSTNGILAGLTAAGGELMASLASFTAEVTDEALQPKTKLSGVNLLLDHVAPLESAAARVIDRELLNPLSQWADARAQNYSQYGWNGPVKAITDATAAVANGASSYAGHWMNATPEERGRLAGHDLLPGILAVEGAAAATTRLFNGLKAASKSAAAIGVLEESVAPHLARQLLQNSEQFLKAGVREQELAADVARAISSPKELNKELALLAKKYARPGKEKELLNALGEEAKYTKIGTGAVATKCDTNRSATENLEARAKTGSQRAEEYKEYKEALKTSENQRTPEQDAMIKNAQKGAADEHIVNPIDPNLDCEAKVLVLREMSEKNHSKLKELAAQIDNQLGGRGKTETSVKGESEIRAKSTRSEITEKKPWFDVEHIRDGLRFRTEVDDLADIPAVLDKLEQSGYKVIKSEPDKLLEPREWGMRMAPFDLRSPDGQIIEYYILPRELNHVMKNGHHNIYKNWRERPVAQLNAEELLERRKAALTASNMAESAWQSYLMRTGQTEGSVRNLVERIAKRGAKP